MLCQLWLWGAAGRSRAAGVVFLYGFSRCPTVGKSRSTAKSLQAKTCHYLLASTSSYRHFNTSMSAEAAVAAYGTWKSPISSRLATEKAVAFQEVHVDRAPGKGDRAYWAEMRFDEAGRYVVCCTTPGEPNFVSVTPDGFNARTKVHEYGGGAHFVHDGVVYFTNFDDQRMYKQAGAGAKPISLTPEGTGWRFADGHFHEKLGLIYAVREDHGVIERQDAKEAVNSIVVINPSTHKQNVLVSGSDFYSSPRVSPDGKRIAWVQWFHPNMPWDTTELWTADLQQEGDAIIIGSPKKLVGAVDTSVMHPRWTPDNQLLYIGDQTDWWNLYLAPSSGDHVNLRPINVEVGGPHWTFGYDYYDIDPSGSGDIVTVYGQELGVLNLNTKVYRELDTGFKSHSLVQFSTDGNIYCKASGPAQFPCIIRVNPMSGKVDVLRESRSLPVDPGYISVPKEISWPTENGDTSHGYYYPPQNKDYRPIEGSLPPLLIKAHGGPTGNTFSTLNLNMQYFTSRGFAVLDVNYRGSTGYGKKYRNALRRKWGLCDVEDCSSGARYLADTGKVDGDRLCIDGGSAGGYTTLACLAFTDVFKAGVSHYGVADIELLAAETHKFESRYMDSLVAPLNKENLGIYHARSPIKHISSINCPVAFFQGDEDKIVLPNQSELMYKGVREKGLSCAYVLFKGEQHGFRKAENIQKALDGEFYFFSKVFGFEAADKHYQMDIANLKE